LESSSPYLSTNTVQLCCLIGASSSQIKPNICLYSNVRRLSGGKEGENYLVTTGNPRQPENFILKVFEFDQPLTDLARVISNSFLEQCFYPDLVDLKYVGTDNFTNEYLIGLILTSLYYGQGSGQFPSAPPRIPALVPAPAPIGGLGGLNIAPGPLPPPLSPAVPRARGQAGTLPGINLGLPGRDGSSAQLNGVIRFIAATVCNSGNKRRGAIMIYFLLFKVLWP
jgi:hypothetical protein